MNMSKCIKESFVVIGKEGSTDDGPGFFQKLWQEASRNIKEVMPLAKVDENGRPLGYWGAMSDMSHSFKPWENGFSKGLYLAGIEAKDDAEAPIGWKKWKIPGYEYIYVLVDAHDIFVQVINYMKENNIDLVGAVHDYTCPEDGQNYMFFPIRKL